MLKEVKTCPVCHETHVLLGEGGYGKCKNDQFIYEEKIQGCNTISCDEYRLIKEEEDIHADD